MAEPHPHKQAEFEWQLQTLIESDLADIETSCTSLSLIVIVGIPFFVAFPELLAFESSLGPLPVLPLYAALLYSTLGLSSLRKARKLRQKLRKEQREAELQQAIAEGRKEEALYLLTRLQRLTEVGQEDPPSSANCATGADALSNEQDELEWQFQRLLAQNLNGSESAFTILSLMVIFGMTFFLVFPDLLASQLALAIGGAVWAFSFVALLTIRQKKKWRLKLDAVRQPPGRSNLD